MRSGDAPTGVDHGVDRRGDRSADPGHLRIGIVAPPWVPVPPPIYGGTELVVDLLARGVTARGHDVVLFASGDSTCPVPRRSAFPRALGTAVAPLGERIHVEEAYRALAAEGVDVIHDHTVAGPALTELHPPGTPVVTTVHGELDARLRSLYRDASASGVSVVAISHAQAGSATGVPIAAVIHHGIDLDQYPLGAGAQGNLLFLGRMSPRKGVHRAIEVARRCDRPLVIAAKMWEPDEHAYFHAVVEPLLGDGVAFVGEVDHAGKVELLQGTAALVNPIRWPEPFGLVMIESLACGTPVLTFAEGAAPEIVETGRTGAICRDESDMVDQVDAVVDLDRAGCRAAVAERFTADRMVEDHLALYRQLLAHRDGIDLREPAPTPAS